MSRWSWMMVFLCLGLVPGRVAQGDAGVSVSTGEVCQGLSPAQCCAQTLKSQAYFALEERLTRKARLVVELACKQPKRKLPAAGCRTLLVARGWSVPDAAAWCKRNGRASKCKKQKSCRLCTKEMRKLGYSNGASMCAAATLHAARKGNSIVVIRNGESRPGGVEVRRTRRRLR